MTVDEYLATFLLLARYFLELVPTEEKKARKFQKRLRRDIGGRMASARYTTMDQIIIAANRAQEFNDGKENKRQTQIAPVYEERPAKRSNNQPYQPPPRFTGG